MRRTLPLILFLVFIGGVLAIEFRESSHHDRAAARETTVENTALNPDGTPVNPLASVPGQTGSANPASPAPQNKPAPPALPPLPEVDVGTHVAHAVPADRAPHFVQNLSPPMPHMNNGYTGSAGGSGSPRTASGQFSGQAQVTGATALMVGATPVQLFGIRNPSPDDRCGAYHCVNVAVVALKSRLLRNSNVSCRRASSGGGSTTAICLDAQGADLSGYLVGEGLARADAAQSYDYVGAEKIARDLGRGLWKR